MTIPTPYLWPLGCLAVLGAIHAVFAIEEVIRKIINAIPLRR